MPISICDFLLSALSESVPSLDLALFACVSPFRFLCHRRFVFGSFPLLDFHVMSSIRLLAVGFSDLLPVRLSALLSVRIFLSFFFFSFSFFSSDSSADGRSSSLVSGFFSPGVSIMQYELAGATPESRRPFIIRDGELLFINR